MIGIRYLLKYPDKAITFYNASHLVIHQLVLTLYKINMELAQSPHNNWHHRYLLTPNKVFIDLLI
jgi:hypothetical protein